MLQVMVPRWMPRWLLRWWMLRKLRRLGFGRAQAEMLVEATLAGDIPTRKGG